MQYPENKINFPTSEELRLISEFENVARGQIASAIKSVYKLQNWSGKELARRLVSVDEKMWQAYGQYSYDRPRYLHIVAALSWLTQISMSAFYRGDISAHWEGVDDRVIQCITICCMLPPEKFNHFILLVLSKVERNGYKNRENVEQALNDLKQYDRTNFMIPEILDVEDFGRDYYRSMSIEFKRLRLANSLTPEVFASCLMISTEKYMQYENININKHIPLEIGARLKLLIKSDTVQFISHMTKYKNFTISRKVQDIREAVLVSLMKDVDQKLKDRINNLAYQLMLFHRS